MSHKKSEPIHLEDFLDCSKISQELRNCIIQSQKVELLIDILPDIFHKLKNKLTPITGYTQLLYLKVSDEENRDKLKRIEKNADELCQILDQLRSYFQKGIEVRARINLNDILRHLDFYFEQVKEKNKIDIEIKPDDTIPEQYLNFGQIENLVMILTDNAVKAIKLKSAKSDRDLMAGETGRIRIMTQNGESGLILSVKDNGIGISPERLSKIWHPFFSEFPEGTGIGLLGCEKILENHEAKVSVKSEEGVGTEFQILFPRKT
jgi:signal transduction histidine kinase